MRKSTAFFLAGASLVSLSPAMAAPADTAAAPVFAADDPAYSGLYALQDEAEDLQNDGPQDGPGKRAIVTAWERLRSAALATLLPDGSPHPLAALADIKIASQLYELGELPEAIERARRGSSGLEGHLDDYALTYAEAIALTGVIMTQSGEAQDALPLVQQGYKRFGAHYATIPAEERYRALVVSKSNLEFALSQVLGRLGENTGALDYQRLSLETRKAGLGEDDPDTVASYYGYAQALMKSERFPEAEDYARLGAEKAIAHVDPSHPSYARSLEMLGIILARSGRPVEATGYLTKALELKREYEGTDNLYFGYGIHNLAGILFNRERYEDAEPFFLEAEPLFREYQGQNSPYAANAAAYAGRISFAEGRDAEAIERLREAQSQLGENGRDAEMLQRIQPDLIRALLAKGKGAEALSRAQAHLASLEAQEDKQPFALAEARLLAAHAAERMGKGGTADALSAASGLVRVIRSAAETSAGGGLATDRRAGLDLAMDVAATHGEATLMLDAMAVLGASSIAQASAMRAERLAAGNDDLAEAIRKLQEAARTQDEAESAYLVALAGGDDASSARQARDAAMAARQAARGDLEQRFPAWASSRPESNPSLADLSASLAPDEAFLAVEPAYHGAYLLLVTPRTSLALKAGLGRAEMLLLAGRLGRSVRAGKFDTAASEALFRAIFPPEIRAELGRTSRLRIHAGGALASLPFALLKDLDAGEKSWLIDRFALTSATDLAPRSGKAEPSRPLEHFAAIAAPEPFAQAADPVLPGAAQAGDIASFYTRDGINRSALAALPPLPATRGEAERIASLFAPGESTLLLGANAQEAALDQPALGNADVLLFATHGLVAGEIEGVAEPALVLSPGEGASPSNGLLTVSEIARLKLSAQWVILSACNSAAGSRGGLPAFSGLAQAFRFAGADTLMVSHWPVRDDVAAFVSVETLRAYRDGMDKASALRAAIEKLREGKAIEDGADPYLWAPFVLLD